MNRFKLYFFIIGYFFISLLYGQEDGKRLLFDSLSTSTYGQLENKFNFFRHDTIRSRAYAMEYLKRARNDNDTLKLADAYTLFSKIYSPAVSEKYADSIIALTKDLDDFTYPAKGFITKAYALRLIGKYKEALDLYLQANQYALKNNNTTQQLYIKYQIGILKNDIGEHEDALPAFKDYIGEIKKMYEKDGEKHVYTYTRALYGLGDSYNRNGLYDSAIAINRIGMNISLEDKNALNPAYFRMSNGITEYFKQNYTESIEESIKAAEGMKEVGDSGNLIICYMCIGKSYIEQGQYDQVTPYYEKIDSIVQATADIFPDLREVYEFLIDYNKANDNTEKQLEYVESLIHIDSVILNNYKHLSKNISKKYDTPRLLSEKDELIGKLEKGNNTFRISVIILTTIVLAVGLLSYNFYRKQRLYRRKFEKLVNGSSVPDNKSKKIATNDLEELNISEEVLAKIVKKLEKFVEKKQFLRHDITLNSLAKSLNTNTKYLSMIVKFYEQKNFITYINDLRINYAIEKLKNNPSFRKYSIKAIGQEIGYNNSQSFSRAFQKKTGIFPSYFIRELEKSQKHNKH
ncbi:helix-turn-helix domain-containing protein [Sinomicrobium sp. M5D2P17]